MKIVADENIPYARQAFAPLGEVTTLPGRNLQPQHIQHCECLLVRSITPVNEQLLKNSPVRFVASATIGTDHIDLNYLQQNDITFANAPGCNAESAAEYMINVLFYLAEKKGFDPFKLTAGIIGCGNVGSRVKEKLDALGITALVNDPPLEAKAIETDNFVSLQTIIQKCDFITCHVPLTFDGDHSTFHLFDHELLSKLAANSILFNASRGAVVDNQALSKLLDQRNDLTIFLDTWEGEPAIDQDLLRKVDFASPHIAGYSVEGRLRGTQMILNAACAYFDMPSNWKMQDYLPGKQLLELHQRQVPSLWYELFNTHYPVENDYQNLMRLSTMPPQVMATEFDRLRKQYPMRYEYSHFQLKNITGISISNQIEKLLFELID